MSLKSSLKSGILRNSIGEDLEEEIGKTLLNYLSSKKVKISLKSTDFLFQSYLLFCKWEGRPSEKQNPYYWQGKSNPSLGILEKNMSETYNTQ